MVVPRAFHQPRPKGGRLSDVETPVGRHIRRGLTLAIVSLAGLIPASASAEQTQVLLLCAHPARQKPIEVVAGSFVRVLRSERAEAMPTSAPDFLVPPATGPQLQRGGIGTSRL